MYVNDSAELGFSVLVPDNVRSRLEVRSPKPQAAAQEVASPRYAGTPGPMSPPSSPAHHRLRPRTPPNSGPAPPPGAPPDLHDDDEAEAAPVRSLASRVGSPPALDLPDSPVARARPDAVSPRLLVGERDAVLRRVTVTTAHELGHSSPNEPHSGSMGSPSPRARRPVTPPRQDRSASMAAAGTQRASASPEQSPDAAMLRPDSGSHGQEAVHTSVLQHTASQLAGMQEMSAQVTAELQAAEELLSSIPDPAELRLAVDEPAKPAREHTAALSSAIQVNTGELTSSVRQLAMMGAPPGQVMHVAAADLAARVRELRNKPAVPATELRQYLGQYGWAGPRPGLPSAGSDSSPRQVRSGVISADPDALPTRRPFKALLAGSIVRLAADVVERSTADASGAGVATAAAAARGNLLAEADSDDSAGSDGVPLPRHVIPASPLAPSPAPKQTKEARLTDARWRSRRGSVLLAGVPSRKGQGKGSGPAPPEGEPPLDEHQLLSTSDDSPCLLDVWLALEEVGVSKIRADLLALRRRTVGAAHEASPEGLAYETGPTVHAEILQHVTLAALRDVQHLEEEQLNAVGVDGVADSRTLLELQQRVHSMVRNDTNEAAAKLRAQLRELRSPEMQELYARLEAQRQTCNELEADVLNQGEMVGDSREAAGVAGVQLAPKEGDVKPEPGKIWAPWLSSAALVALRQAAAVPNGIHTLLSGALHELEQVQAGSDGESGPDEPLVLAPLKALRDNLHPGAEVELRNMWDVAQARALQDLGTRAVSALAPPKPDEVSAETGRTVTDYSHEEIGSLLETLGPDRAREWADDQIAAAAQACARAAASAAAPRLAAIDEQRQRAIDQARVVALRKQQVVEREALENARMAHAERCKAIEGKVAAAAAQEGQLREAIARVRATAAATRELHSLKLQVRQLLAQSALAVAAEEHRAQEHLRELQDTLETGVMAGDPVEQARLDLLRQLLSPMTRASRTTDEVHEQCTPAGLQAAALEGDEDAIAFLESAKMPRKHRDAMLRDAMTRRMSANNAALGSLTSAVAAAEDRALPSKVSKQEALGVARRIADGSTHEAVTTAFRAFARVACRYFTAALSLANVRPDAPSTQISARSPSAAAAAAAAVQDSAPLLSWRYDPVWHRALKLLARQVELSSLPSRVKADILPPQVSSPRPSPRPAAPISPSSSGCSPAEDSDSHDAALLPSAAQQPLTPPRAGSPASFGTGQSPEVPLGRNIAMLLTAQRAPAGIAPSPPQGGDVSAAVAHAMSPVAAPDTPAAGSTQLARERRSSEHEAAMPATAFFDADMLAWYRRTWDAPAWQLAAIDWRHSEAVVRLAKLAGQHTAHEMQQHAVLATREKSAHEPAAHLAGEVVGNVPSYQRASDYSLLRSKLLTR